MAAVAAARVVLTAAAAVEVKVVPLAAAPERGRLPSRGLFQIHKTTHC